MKCLRCGATAPRQASVCPECGRKLWRFSLAWRRCEHCGTLVQASQEICAACGRPGSRPRVAPLLVALLAAVLLGSLAFVNRQAAGRLLARQLAPLPEALNAVARPALATVTLAPLDSQPTGAVTPSAAGAATAKMPRPSATPTGREPTPTQLPTRAPTSGASATPTLLPSATPTPLATAMVTPSPTATATTAAAPPTATPASTAPESLSYAAPVPIAPADGFVFTGQRTDIWLRWESVGELGADDYYAVSLRYQRGGVTAFAGTWYKGVEWLVPKDVWQHYDQGHPEYDWDVVVMRQTGTREDGGRMGESVGAVSETRQFIWK